MEEKTKAQSKEPLKVVKICGNLAFGVLLLVAAVLIFSLLYSKATGGPPTVAGYHTYIVLSGSMNPAFDTGSLVFVKPTLPENIEAEDIITFRGFGEEGRLVSHRVVSVNTSPQGINFTTKGDANDVPDPNPIPPDKLVGKVVLAIPYLGYFMDFSQTKRGVLVLVLIPAVLLFTLEGVSLYKNIQEAKEEEEVTPDPKD